MGVPLPACPCWRQRNPVNTLNRMIYSLWFEQKVHSCTKYVTVHRESIFPSSVILMTQNFKEDVLWRVRQLLEVPLPSHIHWQPTGLLGRPVSVTSSLDTGYRQVTNITHSLTAHGWLPHSTQLGHCCGLYCHLVHISFREVECWSVFGGLLYTSAMMLKQCKNAVCVCVCVVLDNMQALWRWLHHSIHCWKTCLKQYFNMNVKLCFFTTFILHGTY